MISKPTSAARYSGKKPKQFEIGRVCEFGDCSTQLTIYNKQETCYLHTARRVPRLRGMKAEKIETLGVDTSQRCYGCALSLGGWGGEAHEVQVTNGDWHWYVRIDGRAGKALVRLCEVQ
jgi:hypothetical protein